MLSTQALTDLQNRFDIPGVVRIEQGPGDLPRIAIATAAAKARVYLHGAHVAEYQPAGQEPILFMSGKSTYEPTKPIRGGVPVIFPWFGPRAGDPTAPMHGVARTNQWTLEQVSQHGDDVTVVLSLKDTDATRKIWPHAFALTATVVIGKSLAMTLQVHNPSPVPFTFEEALHTYFVVGDIRQVTVTGLAGATYIDKMDGAKRKQQDPQPIAFVGETDRLYLNTRSTCIIDDPKGARRIMVEKSGSASTVVWNPWIAKSKAMADFGDDEWPGMVCVETVNAADNAITLPAGQGHQMGLVIRAEKRVNG